MAANPADILAAARNAKRRMYDRLISLPYDPNTAAKMMIVADMYPTIEPTPDTENGPVVIGTPDTANARLHARELLHAIVAPIAVEFGVTYRFRSDTYVEINHR